MCPLYAYYDIPSGFFVDKYQMKQLSEYHIGNLERLVALDGETNLEAPIWQIYGWGSDMLIQLHDSESGEFEIPLHLRYAEPSNTSGYATYQLAWPAVFRACGSQQELSDNPFDTSHSGYEQYFPTNTKFHHILPHDGAKCVDQVEMPTILIGQAGIIQYVTLITVTLGFSWILWKISKTPGRTKKKTQ